MTATITQDDRWCDRSFWQYDLRCDESSTRRVLMTRLCDEQGKGVDGREVPWRDLATFQSYNDAERILAALRQNGSHVPGGDA